MANEEHLKLLEQGVDVWNKWREDNLEVKPDLREADFWGASHLDGINLMEADLRKTNFTGASLKKACLQYANLTEADLSDAKLIGANFGKANLNGADLSNTDLIKADLIRTNLKGAKLVGANLQHANLRRANLWNADLRETILWETNFRTAVLKNATIENASLWYSVFTDVDLSDVSGLETVKHIGPSSIGIDTLYRSKGNIPEIFLKGCGVPNMFIKEALPLTNSAYHSCFISHSSKDEKFAQRIHNDLEVAGVLCWFAPHDMQGGMKVYDQIEGAIRMYDKLLLILSENSMNSDWVGEEIINAKNKECQQQKQMLFPISIVPFKEIQKWKFFDADTGKDLAKEIREYHIPDFSQWKSDHDAYRESFDRLLHDLKTQ